MKALRLYALAVLVAFVYAVCPRLAAAPDVPRYSVTWIEGDYYPEGGVGLNNRGQVVGGAFESVDTGYQVFVWSHGRKRFLRAIAKERGIPVPYDINESGQIAGSFTVIYSGAITYLQDEGFFWDGRRLYQMEHLPGGVPYTIVKAVSNAGKIVGSTVQHMPNALPDEGEFYTVDASTRGVENDLNDARRQVVGYILSAEIGVRSHSAAILWRDGQRRWLVTPKGLDSACTAINAGGQTVGFTEDASFTRRAVLWADGGMHDLGTLPGCVHSEAAAINTQGQIVGTAYDTKRHREEGTEYVAGKNSRAFLWQAGQMVDLNCLAALRKGQKLEEARAINDRGQIVGYGTVYGDVKIFLLTPRQ
jgi:probable HAF family extracellular repeat protein